MDGRLFLDERQGGLLAPEALEETPLLLVNGVELQAALLGEGALFAPLGEMAKEIELRRGEFTAH